MIGDPAPLLQTQVGIIAPSQHHVQLRLFLGKQRFQAKSDIQCQLPFNNKITFKVAGGSRIVATVTSIDDDRLKRKGEGICRCKERECCENRKNKCFSYYRGHVVTNSS